LGAGCGTKATPEAPVAPNISRLETDLGGRLGAKVRIQHQQNGKGRIEIHYTSLEELDGVLGKIR